jgi:hypothetical protein
LSARTRFSGNECLRSGFSRRYLCNPCHRSIKAIGTPHHPIFFSFLPIQFSDQESLFFVIFTFLGGSSAEERRSNSAKSEIRIEYSQKKIGLKILTRLHSPIHLSNLHSPPIPPIKSLQHSFSLFFLPLVIKRGKKKEKRGKTVWCLACSTQPRFWVSENPHSSICPASAQTRHPGTLHLLHHIHTRIIGHATLDGQQHRHPPNQWLHWKRRFHLQRPLNHCGIIGGAVLSPFLYFKADPSRSGWTLHLSVYYWDIRFECD